MAGFEVPGDIVGGSSQMGPLSPQQSFVGVNDSGCIVGTATYSGSDSSISPGQHAVMLVPAQITRDTQPITSTNNTVCVGQQVQLAVQLSGIPTTAITAYKWSIPGTAFLDYQTTATT